MSKQGIVPVFIPHGGCPHDCVFCNQRKISGTLSPPSPDQVHARIEEGLTYLGPSRSTIEIAYYGGSFTGIDPDLQERYLAIAKTYLDEGRVKGIRLSTRPDYCGQTVIDRLLKYGVTTVELGVQSMDQAVLEASHRGHNATCVSQAVQALQGAGIRVGIQLMIGLPGDHDQARRRTTKAVIAMKPDFVRIYPVVVVKETDLATSYGLGSYHPLPLEIAVKEAAHMRTQLMEADIPVIRVGLQATEDLLGDAVLAGPMHPAMGELVIAESIKQAIGSALAQLPPSEDDLILTCHPKVQSKVVGQKKQTLNQLRQDFAPAQVEIMTDPQQDPGHVAIQRGDRKISCRIFP